MNSYAKKSYMWVCCVFVKREWIMKLWFVEFWMNSWLIVVDDVLKHVVDELVNDYVYLVNWWWKLLLLLNICESLVNYWILTKWCFNLEFWASLSMFSCIWPINIIWDVFWVWKDQNWSVWEKMFWNSKFFFSELKSVRLSDSQRTSSERAHVASRHSSLERAVSEALSERECCFWTKFAWANHKRTLSELAQDATGTWSLKRTRLRLSEQHLFSHSWFFVSCTWGPIRTF